MIGCYLLSGKGLPKIARAPIFCHRKWNRRIVKWWTQFASSKCFFQNHLCQDRALETWSTMNIYENFIEHFCHGIIGISQVFPNIYEHLWTSWCFPGVSQATLLATLPPLLIRRRCHHCCPTGSPGLAARSTLLRRHQTCSNLSEPAG